MSEVIEPEEGTTPDQNRVIREGYQGILDALGFVEAGGTIKEQKERFNGANATPSLAPFTLKKDHTRVLGNATAIEQSKQAASEKDCYINGILFSAGREMSSDPLFKVTEGARAVITNCLFHRGDGDGSASFVEVESGSSAIIMGCAFIGTATVADAVLHTGAAANVQLIGCSGRNVTAFGANTTVTASLL